MSGRVRNPLGARSGLVRQGPGPVAWLQPLRIANTVRFVPVTKSSARMASAATGTPQVTGERHATGGNLVGRCALGERDS